MWDIVWIAKYAGNVGSVRRDAITAHLQRSFIYIDCNVIECCATWIVSI